MCIFSHFVNNSCKVFFFLIARKFTSLDRFTLSCKMAGDLLVSLGSQFNLTITIMSLIVNNQVSRACYTYTSYPVNVQYVLIVTCALMRVQPPPPPPPPHSGVGGTACVFPKSPVKGYFSCDKVRPENCKKRGVFDFSPGDFFF